MTNLADLPDPLFYRQEILAPLFHLIRTGESSVLAGAASMGKSRLVQHLLHPAVKEHYLGAEAAKFLFVWVDCNRMAAVSEWGLYELILTALLEVSGEQPGMAELRAELHQSRKEVILTGNALLAQRTMELVVHQLCHEKTYKICLVLDEFDESYQILPGQALANLRSLRDANKYRLTYLLLMRDDPAHLRPPSEGEGFYEILSRSVLGLTPHTHEDLAGILQRIAARRDYAVERLDETSREKLIYLSGGHPGLLATLLDAAIHSPPIGVDWLVWAVEQPKVQEECRKIWVGLRNQERQTLHYVAHGLNMGYRELASLLLKGLLCTKAAKVPTFFSALFEKYAFAAAPAPYGSLHVDETAGTVWVNGKQCEALTDKEYKLLLFLFKHPKEICATKQIIDYIYPGEESFNVNDNTIAALVKRVREKIEPDLKHPRYIKNIKGRGYQLVVEPT